MPNATPDAEKKLAGRQERNRKERKDARRRAKEVDEQRSNDCIRRRAVKRSVESVGSKPRPTREVRVQIEQAVATLAEKKTATR